ncbi:MAG: metalloregulator ArsR/SmtB family transcription factor [Acidobacteriota bacterium]
MSGENKKFNLELFFSALADKTRLRLLNLMREDEICVCFFVEILATNQPKISRHLAYLRKAGLVAARRDAKWMHYRIIKPTQPQAAKIFADLMNWLAEDPEMQKDRRQLSKICCAPQLPIQLRSAPIPVSMAKNNAV